MGAGRCDSEESDDESDEEEDTNETTIEAIKIPVNADLTNYSSGVENYLAITEVTRQLIQDKGKALPRNQPTSGAPGSSNAEGLRR